jgi:hypothetical protein
MTCSLSVRYQRGSHQMTCSLSVRYQRGNHQMTCSVSARYQMFWAAIIQSSLIIIIIIIIIKHLVSCTNGTCHLVITPLISYTNGTRHLAEYFYQMIVYMMWWICCIYSAMLLNIKWQFVLEIYKLIVISVSVWLN